MSSLTLWGDDLGLWRENLSVNPADEPAARQPHSLELDRKQPLRFTFDGQSFIGHRGDTLATALLANGVRLGGRSPRYRRPLGVGGQQSLPVRLQRRCAGRWQQHAVWMDDQPLFDGLVARSFHGWPSAKWDLGWDGDGLWQAATQSPAVADATTTYDDCDVLVIGGGPAGVATAYAAMQQRLRVCLVHRRRELGGGARLMPRQIAHYDGREWLRRTESRLRQGGTVRLNTTALGRDGQQRVWLQEICAATPHEPPTQRLWRVRARHVVMATGGQLGWINTPRDYLPGVFQFHQAVRYALGYGVRVAQRAVLYLDQDVDLRDIALLEQIGIEWLACVDRRRSGPSAELSRWLQGRRIPLIGGHLHIHGNQQVNRVTVQPFSGPSRRFLADAVLICSRPRKTPPPTFAGLAPLEGVGVGVMGSRWLLDDALRHGYAVGQRFGAAAKRVQLPMRVRKDSPRLPVGSSLTGGSADPLGLPLAPLPLAALATTPRPRRTSPLQPFHQLQVTDWWDWGPWHWPWRYPQESATALETGALVDVSCLAGAWVPTATAYPPHWSPSTGGLPQKHGYLPVAPVQTTAPWGAEGWGLLLLTGQAATDALEAAIDGLFSPERLKVGSFAEVQIAQKSVYLWRVTLAQQGVYLLAMAAPATMAVALTLLVSDGGPETGLQPIGAAALQRRRLQAGLLPNQHQTVGWEWLPLCAPQLPSPPPHYGWRIVHADRDIRFSDRILDDRRREVGEWALLCGDWAVLLAHRDAQPGWLQGRGERKPRPLRMMQGDLGSSPCA